MGKWLIGALLAATAWAPMAQAQDGGWRGRRGGDGQQSGQQPQPQQGGGWQGRGSWGGQRQAQPQAQAQAGAQVQAQGSWRQNRGEVRTDVQPQSGWQGRRDWQRGQPQQQAQPQQVVPQQSFGGRDRNGDGRPDWRGDNRPSWSNRDRNGDGRPDSWNRAPDQRAQANRGWSYSGRNDRFDNRGSWNRTWRNDGRYDWGRYRSTNRNLFRLPRYYAPYGWGYGYRRFSVGVVLSSILWEQDYWIDDPWSYRLPEAYGPYRWVRYYNDALLVDIRSGQVVDTVYDIFW